MEHIEITIEISSQEEIDRLIALLDDFGFEGFEEDNQFLKAYISSENFNENLFNVFIEENDLKHYKSIIKETNWNEKWESSFQPILIHSKRDNAPFVYIRAHFHAPHSSVLHDLNITPKMSFGTGHHATTYLMIQEMAELDFNGKFVVDFGTGTGALAILAEKMGATGVLGIDNDNWSISNANENITTNKCENIKIINADKCLVLNQKADILLANINLNIIKENLPAIKDCVKENGIVLFSGILKNNLIDIENAIKSSGLNIVYVLEKDNWLLINAVN